MARPLQYRRCELQVLKNLVSEEVVPEQITEAAQKSISEIRTIAAQLSRDTGADYSLSHLHLVHLLARALEAEVAEAAADAMAQGMPKAAVAQALDMRGSSSAVHKRFSTAESGAGH